MARRRTKLAPGVWRDKHGISVVARTADRYREVRFPHDTELRTLKNERERLKVELRDGKAARRTERGTLASDVARYLKARAAMPTIAEREKHLQLWIDVFGENRRTLSIEPHEIAAQRDAWLVAGKSPSTVSHYLRALSNLVRTIYPNEPNQVRRVKEPAAPAPLVRAVDPKVVGLILGKMRDSKAKARLLVMATTGIPYATLKRLERRDVDLRARTVHVPPRHKGKGAEGRILPLSADAVEAFKAISRWGCWGSFSNSTVHRAWRLARDKAEAAINKNRSADAAVSLRHLRPYDLRHNFAVAVSRATGGNVATIAHLLGHGTLKQSEIYRAAAVPEHLRDAVGRLEMLVGSRKKPSKKRR